MIRLNRTNVRADLEVGVHILNHSCIIDCISNKNANFESQMLKDYEDENTIEIIMVFEK